MIVIVTHGKWKHAATGSTSSNVGGFLNIPIREGYVHLSS